MNTKRIFIRAAGPMALATMIGFGLGACSSSAKTATSSSTAAGATTNTTASSATAAPGGTTKTVAIQGFMFKPSPAQGKVGDTITVSNADNTDHSLTANDNSFDSGVFSSGTKTITLSKAGTIAYHCKIHNFMTGTIQVSG